MLSIIEKIIRKLIKIVFIFITIIVSIIVIAILLNFVPVKYAVNLDDAKNDLKVGSYISVTESKYVLDTGWIAKTQFNSHLDDDICLKMSGKSPSNYLSEKTFDFKWFEVENKFLLKAKVVSFIKDNETYALFIF